MSRYLNLTAAAVGAIAVASSAWAQSKPTIGISYQNLAFPYVAALQKAAQETRAVVGH